MENANRNTIHRLFWFGFALLIALSTTAIEQSEGNRQKHDLFRVSPDFATAINAKDATAAASVYTDDAVLMPPNQEPVRGRSNIEAFLKGILAEDISVTSITPEDASKFGLLGYEVGSFEFSVGPPDHVTHDRGRYIYVLRRGADGRWRVKYEIFNSSLPAEPAK